MSMLEHALAWASRGFPVFPLQAGMKEPIHDDWPSVATTDLDAIRRMWTDPVLKTTRDYNIGMLCSDRVVVDIDVKKGKDGHNQYMQLGGTYETLVVRTPSGGFHCYFEGPDSANVAIAPDVDIRSHNGFVVAPGSRTIFIEGKQAEGVYEIVTDVAPAWVPLAVEERLHDPYARREGAVTASLDTAAGIEAGVRFAQSAAPAIEGQRGDEATFVVAARLVREMALSPEAALAIMWEHYNPRCVPPWSYDELQGKIENAAQYGSADMGRLDPSVMFATVGELPEPVSLFVQSGLEFGNGLDETQTPSRPWMLDRMLMLHETTLLLAAGSAGKSSIALAIAAHLALGRDFGPHKAHTRCKSIVYNGEDDRAEQSRRLQAVCALYELDYNIVRREIMLISAADIDLKFVSAVGRTAIVNEAMVQQFIDMASNPEVGLVIYDPLVDIHDVDEGDNPHMNAVMRVIGRIGRDANVASLVLHHTSKAGGRPEDRAGNMDVARGASGIVYKSRIAFTLMPASETDCEEYGIQPVERTAWVRMDDAKMNLALASTVPTWFHKHGMRIRSGDTVGALRLEALKKDAGTLRLRCAEIILAALSAGGTATLTMTQAIALVKAEEPLYANRTDADLKQKLTGYFMHAVEVRGQTLQFVPPNETSKTPLFIMK